MANRYDNNVKVAFAWYMYIRKRRQLFRTRYKSNIPPGIWFRKLNKRVALIQAILAYCNIASTTRKTFMDASTFADSV